MRKSHSLTGKEIEKIKYMCEHKISSKREIAEMFGVSRTTIQYYSGGKERIKNTALVYRSKNGDKIIKQQKEYRDRIKQQAFRSFKITNIY